MPYPGSLTTDLTGFVKQYSRNVSNADGGANITSCTANTDVTLPLIANGSNNYVFGTVATGKLEFDATFNGSKGGLLTDQIANDTEMFVRMTIVNLATPTDVIAKMFLVFDKTVPGTGVKISSSPIGTRQDVEQTVNFKAFMNGIEAIYPQLRSDNTRDFQLRGLDVTMLENQ